MKKIFYFLIAIIILASCNYVEPNHEGILMKNYGQNGISDFSEAHGNVGLLWFGKKLYEVPMNEATGDPQKVTITANKGGTFDVDPTYTYQPIRGQGVNLVFNYKHVGMEDPTVSMENIEVQILNQLVINAYKEEARSYSTDSLLANLNAYETQVEAKLRDQFLEKGFALKNLTSGLTPPESMVEAINKKNNALIEAQTVLNNIETSKNLQAQALIEAETNRIRAEGLPDKILMQQWIDAIRWTNNKVIITDGKTPIIFNH